MEYNIFEVEVATRNGIGEDLTDKPDQGGDMNLIESFKTKVSALKRAKKLSYASHCNNGTRLHEIWLEAMNEEGDIIEQWSFKDGNTKFHIKPN